MLSPEKDCSRCGLCSGRTNLVLPCGDLRSKVVFVGEAPGENEDLQGIPFVGRAGKILNDALSAAGIDRDSVMITNTVKCRPPNNRDPTHEEMAACRMFLDSELEDRELVIGLGRSAIRDLIGYEGGMKEVINKVTEMEVNGKRIRFLPAYHPMACVYRKEARTSLAETMQIVKEFMRK